VNVAEDLLRIVERAHSLPRILGESARAVAERLQTDACLVFLLDERGDLALAATSRATPDEGGPRGAADAQAVAALAVQGHRGVTARGATAERIASPLLLRDSPVGALVLERALPRGFSTGDAEALAAIGAHLVGIVENARIIDAIDRGERPAPHAEPRRASALPEEGERTFRGLGASPGVAVGPAVLQRASHPTGPAGPPAGDPSAERARVRTAFDKTRNDLTTVQSMAAREIGEEQALIFASHLLLLGDPTLLGHIDERIALGASAPHAVDAALGDFEARLGQVTDAYLRERIDDVDDLRGRLLDHLLGGGRRARLGASVVVTNRIPPSLVMELKTEGALALVTEGGGATSHGVLLARAMGIPVVTGIADLLGSVQAGDLLAVDGTTGTVVVRPGAATVARCEEARQGAERTRTEHAKFRGVLARTADGVRVALLANVGVASDLATARENGAEGVGLYRTEFPFIVRDSFPTRPEQVRIYAKAFDAFPAGPVNFRLLDLGGDKFVAGGAVAAARSAFHGYRAIRVLFDHPAVLTDQVQALALAAGGRPLRILVPMVASLDEFRRIRQMVEEALAGLDDASARRTPELGAMVEVPAAVELAAELAAAADFLSIGTNDLMQYALVVDREDPRMAPLSDPYHPAVLRMVARVAAAGRAAGTPVGVCGEVAVRPDVAMALVALGVDSLSVVPTAIPGLKQALAGLRLEPMRRAMPAILALPDGRAVAAALGEALRS